MIPWLTSERIVHLPVTIMWQTANQVSLGNGQYLKLLSKCIYVVSVQLVLVLCTLYSAGMPGASAAAQPSSSAALLG